MAACILNDGENTISNVPDLADVRTMMELLETLGARCEYADGELLVNSRTIDRYKAPYELVKTMRASVLVLGTACGQIQKSGGLASRWMRDRGETHRSAHKRASHSGGIGAA